MHQLSVSQIAQHELFLADAIVVGSNDCSHSHMRDEICREAHRDHVRKGTVSFIASRIGRPQSPAVRWPTRAMRVDDSPFKIEDDVTASIERACGRQAEHDLSIPDQRAQTNDWAAGRDLKVVAEYIKPPASATDDKRPEFKRMVE